MSERAASTTPAGGPAAAEKDPRVYLAGERTMLAWVRTGLAMMGFGFVVARFGLFLRELESTRQGTSNHVGPSLWIGTAIVLLGVLVNGIGAVRHVRFARRFHRGDRDLIPPSATETFIPVALAVIGFGMAAYLVLLSRP